MRRVRTVPSPIPASNTRKAGGTGWRPRMSKATRSAITCFSLQVLTKRRYFSPVVVKPEMAFVGVRHFGPCRVWGTNG